MCYLAAPRSTWATAVGESLAQPMLITAQCYPVLGPNVTGSPAIRLNP